MPIASIISQPPSNQLMAAYRPVLITADATATNNAPKPPVVYCDIYFNGVFYKSLSKTQSSAAGPASSWWTFDLQDAAQEYLGRYLSDVGSGMIENAGPVMLEAFCRLRSSGVDSSGFIQQEGVIPVQATGNLPATSGTGTQTNTFYILNATLQHDDNQDLATHLDYFRQRQWTNDAWPLTHRSDQNSMTPNDSDSFGIVYTGSRVPSSIVLNYRLRFQSAWRQLNSGPLVACPLVTGIQNTIVDNGDGTQTFSLSYSPLPAVITGVNLKYRVQGSTGAYTLAPASPNTPITLTVPIGLYEFILETSGACVSSSRTIQYAGVPPSPCTAVATIGIPSMPNANINTAYNYSIALSGTAPFVLNNVVKPSWMTIAIANSRVVFSGTPTVQATNVDVSFDVQNCFNRNVFTISGTINVNAQTNVINVVISPGNMDTQFYPPSFWQWTGTINILDTTNHVVGTKSWSGHQEPGQVEAYSLSSLPNGTYTIEWFMQCIQGGNPVLANVQIILGTNSPETRPASDGVSVNLTGSTAITLQIMVNVD